jgi:hypothetical protein
VTDYRLALAARGSTGLGTVLMDNIQTLGFEMGDQAAIRWTMNLDAAGSLEFSLPIDAPGLTPNNFSIGRELHLYRTPTGGAESLVWAGHLWTINVDAPWVRFMGIGWYETLRHRQIRDDFYRKAYEQLDSAWELIAYTQAFPNGNIGITRGGGSSGSGINRTVLHCAEECTGISDAIEDLAGSDDGFDFDITPHKIWKTYYPTRGVDRSATVILDGGSNITGLSYTIDGTQVENDVAGVGPTKECEPIHFQSQINANSQAAYGLMQSSISRSDQGKDTETIDGLAREQLKIHKSPLYQPSATLHSELDSPNPVDGDYDLGDVVGLAANWGFATFSTAVRLLGYTVNVDRIGRESLDLTLDAGVPSTVPSGGNVVIGQGINVNATIGSSLDVFRPSFSRAQAIAVTVVLTPSVLRKKLKQQAIAATSAITAAVVATKKTPILQAIAAAFTGTVGMTEKFPIKLSPIVAAVTNTIAITTRLKRGKTIAIANTNTISITATKVPGGTGGGFDSGFDQGFA